MTLLPHSSLCYYSWYCKFTFFILTLNVFTAVPNDAKLAEEIARVQKAKDSAVSSQAVANPSKECLDICAKSKPSRSNDKECVVTCITTMRSMSYKLAKLFL